jgi:hypothetical protein
VCNPATFSPGEALAGGLKECFGACCWRLLQPPHLAHVWGERPNLSQLFNLKINLWIARPSMPKFRVTTPKYNNSQKTTAKVAQNVAAGVAGFVVPVLWFGMDFQGTADKEAAALQARQQYLGAMAVQKRCGGPPQTASR